MRSGGITRSPRLRFHWSTDPRLLPAESEEVTTKGIFKTVTLLGEEELRSITRKLDVDQRMGLSILLNYVMDQKLVTVTVQPSPPLMIFQGGAGAGKSLLINTMSQWIERLLRKSGDDPDKPYVLVTAFTGTAASNVEGMILHSAFNFNFGNQFMSLGDKARDEKREHLKNL